MKTRLLLTSSSSHAIHNTNTAEDCVQSDVQVASQPVLAQSGIGHLNGIDSSPQLRCITTQASRRHPSATVEQKSEDTVAMNERQSGMGELSCVPPRCRIC